MPVRKYYCDYCDKQFQDTPADRKRHERGIQHQQAKVRWYDSFKNEQHLSNGPSSQGMPKPLCYHFVNTGFCHFGESCKYFHPDANNILQSTMINAPNNISQPSTINAPNNIPQPSMISTPNNILQPSMITPIMTGTAVQNMMGMSWDNLPPSLQPPPEGQFSFLPLQHQCLLLPLVSSINSQSVEIEFRFQLLEATFKHWHGLREVLKEFGLLLQSMCHGGTLFQQMRTQPLLSFDVGTIVCKQKTGNIYWQIEVDVYEVLDQVTLKDNYYHLIVLVVFKDNSSHNVKGSSVCESTCTPYVRLSRNDIKEYMRNRVEFS